MDRLPPHSPEMEKAVLATVMLKPSLANDIVLVGVDGDSFYDLRHRTLWETLSAQVDEGNPVDIASIATVLLERKMLDAVGGMSYVVAMPESVPSVEDWEHYATSVVEFARRRAIIRHATNAVASSYENEPSTDVAGTLEDNLFSLPGSHGHKVMTIEELLNAATENIEKKASGQFCGYETRFSDLRPYFNTFEVGNVLVLAGRPSAGKTTLAMDMALETAIKGEVTLVFSLEMSGVSLVERMILCNGKTGIPGSNFEMERDSPKIVNATAAISRSAIQICDSAIKINDIVAECRRRHIRKPVSLVIIDYLQLVQVDGKDNRQLEVADASAKVKRLARELNARLILVSQLNRLVEREKREPRLSDLRESGAIEQDADLVCFLWNKEEEGEEDQSGSVSVASASSLGDPRSVNFKIAKNRNGPVGIESLTFIPTQFRFESAAKFGEEDIADRMAGLTGGLH